MNSSFGSEQTRTPPTASIEHHHRREVHPSRASLRLRSLVKIPLPTLLVIVIIIMLNKLPSYARSHSSKNFNFLPRRIQSKPNGIPALGSPQNESTSEPLQLAGSNFTSYIADQDSNLVWPASAAGPAKSGGRKKQATRYAPAPSARELDREPPLLSPVEIAIFDENGGGDDDDDEEEDEEGQRAEEEEEDKEDEAALAALLGDRHGRLDLPDERDTEEDKRERDFYSRPNPFGGSAGFPVRTARARRRRRHGRRSSKTSGVRRATETAERVEPQPGDAAKGKFDDFDDYEALRLRAFYGESNATRTPHGDDQNSTFWSTQAPKVASAGELESSGLPAPAGQRTTKKRKRNKATSLSRKRRQRQQQAPDSTSPGEDFYKPEASREPPASSVRLAAASHLQQEQRQYGAVASSTCATFTQTGVCMTFDSVEWAIRQARRLIGFSRPSGLNSLEPSESTIHAVGELTEWTSRLLAVRYGLGPDDMALGLEQVDTSRTSLWRSCPRIFRSPMARQCYTMANAVGRGLTGDQAVLLSGRYRTHTGQCNNPITPHFGSSFMPFVRLNTPEYGDGLGSIRFSRQSGSQLPPARLVSLSLHPAYEAPSSDLSAMFSAWGQLINHDLALASGARVATGHDGSCCSRVANPRLSQLVADPLNRVCMPILIGPGDPVYAPYGVRCHDFKRSIAGLRPACSLGPRTQVNLVTSFVDASFVYGSTRSAGGSLRSANRRGQLAVWYYFARAGRQPLLPPQIEEPDEECAARPEGLYCFRSGDSRTNQQVPLVALHTIHTRQHNRLARALALINPHWSGERLYNEARHIHVAQVQHILLSEYLPELLGARLLAKFGLEEAPAYWDHYEPGLNPGISQEFAAAAFRQGHSSVPSQVYRLDPLTRTPRRAYNLRELFRQPWALFEEGAVDEFLTGLVDTPAQGLDPFVSLELTGHLLEEPGEPVGLDLIAINIQRGRDQGVASYNSMREWCGLSRLADFADLERVVGKQSGQMMADLYESVDDIDLYSGGLSELPLGKSQLGPTFACIVGHQLGQLRRADRYWFESSQGPHAFTPAQLASIKQVPLARLICANSDQLHLMQPLAMRLPHPIYNPLATCNELPDLDLSLWYEPAPAGVLAEDDD